MADTIDGLVQRILEVHKRREAATAKAHSQYDAALNRLHEPIIKAVMKATELPHEGATWLVAQWRQLLFYKEIEGELITNDYIRKQIEWYLGMKRKVEDNKGQLVAFPTPITGGVFGYIVGVNKGTVSCGLNPFNSFYVRAPQVDLDNGIYVRKRNSSKSGNKYLMETGFQPFAGTSNLMCQNIPSAPIDKLLIFGEDVIRTHMQQASYKPKINSRTTSQLLTPHDIDAILQRVAVTQ